jgi:hypothetical protein
MGSFGSVLSTLYKAYVYKTLIGDLSRFVRRTFDSMDFDKESLLNRAGLTTYTPMKDTVGGVSVFLLGALAGGAVALALAPKPGRELRAEVKERAMDLMGRTEDGKFGERRTAA